MVIGLNMKIKSFKLKLILSYLLIILVSFGLTMLFLENKLEKNFLHNIEDSLIKQATLIQAQISPLDIEKENMQNLDRLIDRLSSQINCRITVIDLKGKVLADSEKTLEEIPFMENHLRRPEISSALVDGIGINKRYSNTLNIDMLYVAIPIRYAGSTIGVVRLALTLESVKKALRQINQAIFIAFLYAFVLACVLGFIIAHRGLQPVRQMIEVARSLSKGDFSQRIAIYPTDELGDLAIALNNMAEDIENKIREVRIENQKLTALLNSMLEGTLVIDNRGSIVSINPTAENIFGIKKSEAEGKNLLEVIRNHTLAELIDRVFKEGKAVSEEIELVYPLHKIFKINAAPVFDSGSVNLCIAVIHDITQMRMLENVRRDFVANISHEIKTPLTSIKGFVETLLEGALDDKQNSRNFLEIIQEHTDRLNKLLDDLLSLAYLESKEIRLEKEKFNLRQQIQEVISTFVSQIKKKNITFKNDISEDTYITADKNKIQQILVNLIDNGIKFNKENGSVRIFMPEEANKIKIFVEDTGIGIPAKDIPRIFERFYRVDKARSRQMGGTGLGLSIVKHIVELHAGEVGVESQQGLGTKFWFTLPK